MAIFGFIGNYFWTHYFFNLLGAAYTLPSHRLNGVSACASGQPAMH
jgi:cycloeucalenol cycloisomerase